MKPQKTSKAMDVKSSKRGGKQTAADVPAKAKQTPGANIASLFKKVAAQQPEKQDGDPTRGLSIAEKFALKRATEQEAGLPTAKAAFTDEERGQYSKSLLSWYDDVHRVLPWRRNPHSKLPADKAAEGTPAPAGLPPQEFAYYVWVSEIMLQQTQVATVKDYFRRWTAKWPNVRALADATQEEVNQVWSGLGYYRRAKYLLDGARYVRDKLQGQFPTTAKGLLQIPGVGAYTAAAIASIVFSDQAAAVDGNVIRVVSRLRALAGDPRKLAAVHAELAQQLLDAERPGCHNQAMMELGATVCKPRDPSCTACPVRRFCRARAAYEQHVQQGGDPDIEGPPAVTAYPEKVQKADKKVQTVATCILRVLPQGEAATAAAAAAAGPSGSAGASQQDTAAQPDQEEQQQEEEEEAGAGSGEESGEEGASKAGKGKGGKSKAGKAAPLADDGHLYLLVQRPAEGLLAGLWEFPGMEAADAEVDEPQRQQLVQPLLHSLLGLSLPGRSAGQAQGKAAQIQLSAAQVQRQELGSFVHLFSHIRQTQLVDVVTIMVEQLGLMQELLAAAGPGASSAQPPAEAPAGKAGKKAGGKGSKQQGVAADAARACKWVRLPALQADGISTGVRKALKLLSAGRKRKAG